MTVGGTRHFWWHIAALFVFVVATLIVTRPLAQVVSSGVIGAGAGDNMSALWNIWWARTAWHGDASLFFSPALYAPEGTSLVLHSFCAVVSLAASAIGDPVAAYNVALLAVVFLNFVCAYAAAWRLTRDFQASVLAALVFGASPCLLSRLQGHLNVLAAWGLPLVFIAVLRYERDANWRNASALAGVLGILVYTDYYYAIFGGVLAAIHLLLSLFTLDIRERQLTPWRRRLLLALIAVALIDLTLMLWITVTGGADNAQTGLSVRTTFNPRVVLGILAAAAIYVWKWPTVRSVRNPHAMSPRVWRFLPVVGGVLSLLLVPLLQAAVELWRASDYHSQTYLWRSAPPGIDLAAFALGNPMGWLTGPWTTRVYEQLGLDTVEGAVWIGVVPMALLALALRRRAVREVPHLAVHLSPLLWIGTVFFVWSCGPYLRIAGFNTAIMLPQTLLRFVPLAANARIPGRAFAVVALVVALIAALSVASLPPPRRRLFVAVAFAILLIDMWPRAQVWTPIQRPPIYDTLKTLPRGVLLEVPFGIRDGFGESGKLDHWTLFYQTIHQQPLMGGFVARLSPRLRAAHESDPIIRPLLDASAGLAPEPLANGCRGSLACAVRYLVLDRANASPELQTYVERVFQLTPIQSDQNKTLFRVERLRICDCGG